MAIQSCPKRRATLALLTAVAVAVAVVVVVSSSVFVVVVGAEDNNDDPPPPPNQNKKKRKKVRAKFVNQLPDTAIEVYWENPSDHTHKFEANIRPRGGWHVSDTFVGHVFSYVVDGKRHYVTIGPGNEHGEAFVVMAGDGDGFPVRCDVSVSTTSSHLHGGKQRTTEIVDILVKPYWSHRGAVRFLELVRSGYYDGVVFHRSMPDFVTQFGIARDYDVRTRERKNAMQDDDDAASRRGGIKFERGYLSFAGYGPNSRSTEVFVVNAGVSESELGKFGDNRWERPFGHIIVAVGDDADDDDGALSRIYSGYGDMFPFGDGPDPNRIYDVDGYTTYIPREFPKLDYIERCYIVNEVGGIYSSGMSKGEL